MRKLNWSRWLKWIFPSRSRTIQRTPRLRPGLEILEDRLAPAVFTWDGGGSPDPSWNNPLNWDQALPVDFATAGNDLVFPIGLASGLRITNNNISNAEFSSITIDDVDYTLAGLPLTLGNASAPGVLNLNSNGLGFSGAGSTISFNIAFGGPLASGNQQIFVNQGGGFLTVSGQLSGSKDVVMTKAGPGTLSLGGANTALEGDIRVVSGVLQVTNKFALGDLSVALTLSGATPFGTQFSLSVGAATTAPITYTGTLSDVTAIQTALNNLNTVSGPGGTVVVSQVVPGDFTVVFGGGLITSGLPSLSSSVDVGTGTVAFSSPNTTVDNTVIPSGQLRIQSATAETFPENLVLSGPGPAFGGGALLNMSPAATTTWTGNIRMDGDSTIGVGLVGIPAGALTIHGVISDSGDRSLIKEGPGKLTLQPYNTLLGNTYRGKTTIEGGIVSVGHPFALGTGGNTANDTIVNHSLTESGTVALEFTPTDPQILIGTQYFNYAVAQTLTLSGATAGTTQITLSAGNASATPITYTGTPATDQVNIKAALESLSTIGGIGGIANVKPITANVFQVIFAGGLAGLGLPILDATVSSGTATVTSNSSVIPVTFRNALGNVNWVNMTPNFAGLSGINPTLIVVSTVTGGAGVNAEQSLIFGGTISGGSFTLDFNNGVTTQTTANISYSPDPSVLIANVQAALDALSNIGTGNTLVGTPVGFKVPDELVTLNGWGERGIYTSPRTMASRTGGPVPVADVTGTLQSLKGENSWERDITFWTSAASLAANLNPGVPSNPAPYYEHAIALGASLNASLTINGVIQDNGIGAGFYSLSKVGFGRVILTNVNTMIADIDILQGALNIRDSNALGVVAGIGQEAWFGTSLELQADGIPDSATSVRNQQGTIISPNYNLSIPTLNNVIVNAAGLNNQGSLYNISGANRIDGTLNMSVSSSIGVAANPDPLNRQGNTWNNLSQLTINGLITGGPHLTKVGLGEMVLTNANPYGGQTFIDAGWVTIQDRQALGTFNAGINETVQPGTTVLAGAGLNLKQNQVLEQQRITLGGAGLTPNLTQFTLTFDGQTTPLPLTFTGVAVTDRTAIEAALNALPNIGLAGAYVTVSGANPFTVTFRGSLAGIDLPQLSGTVVATAATITTAEVVKGSTNSLNFFENLTLSGTGFTHPSPWLNQMGALESLGGENVSTGKIILRPSIAVTFQNALGNRALGTMRANTAGLVGGRTAIGIATAVAGGNGVNAVQIITFAEAQTAAVPGITAGNFTLSFFDGTTVRTTANITWSATLATLITNITNALNALTPSNTLVAASGDVGIGVELDGSLGQYPPISLLTTRGTISETEGTGGIAKLGTRQLIIQGEGTYNGNVDIRQGMVRIQHDTALGAAPGTSGTIVQAGAALELAPTVPELNGGITAGLEIWNEKLTLKGTGNTTFGVAPLAASSQDIVWRGPISLLPSVTVTFQTDLANADFAPMTFNSSLSGATPTIGIAATTVGGNGVNAAQTLSFTGVSSGTFTLTFNGQTTGSITWSSTPSVLVDRIQTALNALATVGIGAGSIPNSLVTANNPLIDVYPNSRLTVTGIIDDNLSSMNNGSDLSVLGSGELGLAGANIYRGTTFVGQVGSSGSAENPGVLTITHPKALGNSGFSEVQILTLTGAIANTTQFTLTFNGSPATSVITYTGTAADLTSIQNALNTLTTIGGVTGTATVVADPLGFRITLGGTLTGFNQPKIVPTITSGVGTGLATVATTSDGGGGTVVADRAQLQMAGSITVANEPLIIQGNGTAPQPEMQTVTLGGAILGSPFTLTFNGETTDALPFGATAAQVQAEVNQLTTVNTGGGFVNVYWTSPTTYTFIFRGSFSGIDQNQITSDGVSEVQKLRIADGAPLVTQYTLTFAGRIITDATNASPIVITSLNHGLATGAQVTVSGVAGNSAANGAFTVTVVDPDTFSLDTSNGTGAYTGGGSWTTGGAVSGASSPATPIVITTALPHGLANGAQVNISGVGGNTAANGNFTITVTGLNTFELNGTTSNGVYALGTGSWRVTTTTAPLTFSGTNSDAPAIQGALNAILNGGGGDVTVAALAGSTTDFTVTFGGTFAGFNQALLTGNVLVGPGNIPTLITLVNGSPAAMATAIQGGSPIAIPLRWFSMGPSPLLDGPVPGLVGGAGNISLAGRITGVAVDSSDPNVIYVTAAGGGAWKTINSGLSWNSLFDQLPVSSETQKVATPPAPQGSDPTGSTFTLSFNGQSTNPIPYDAAAATVQTELTLLPSFPAGGTVNVTKIPGVDEQQTISFRNAVGGTSKYTLSFNGATTGQLDYGGVSEVQRIGIQAAIAGSTNFTLTMVGVGVGGGGPTSPPITYQNTGAATGPGTDITNITNALESRPGIGVGNVLVNLVNGFPNPTWQITYRNALAGLNIAQATLQVQIPTGGASPFITGGGPPAPVASGGITDVNGSGGGQDALAIQTALNGLPTIAGIGGFVTVVAIGGNGPPAPVGFIVTFGGSMIQADQPMISGLITAGGGNIVVDEFTHGVPITYNVLFGGSLALTNVAEMTGSTTGNLETNISTPVQGGSSPRLTITGGGITIAPSDRRVIYFGTGEGNNSGDSFYGSGVYKSEDSGRTWELLTDIRGNNLFDRMAVNKIVVDPINEDLFYVATSDRAASGLAGNGNINRAFDPNPGVWRYLADDIIAASNSTPISITTQSYTPTNPIPLITGDRVIIEGVQGNTGANGGFIVTVTGFNSFTLNGSIGSGAFTGGGTWTTGWYNLTNVVSTTRAGLLSPQATPPQYTNPPNTPGPNDNYLFDFPQRNASWTDLGIIYTRIAPNDHGTDPLAITVPVLYATLGTANNGPVTHAVPNGFTITITTAEPHELQSGAQVQIMGVGGTTAANNVTEFSVIPPFWTITVLNQYQFTIPQLIATGGYTGGGTWTMAHGTNNGVFRLHNPDSASNAQANRPRWYVGLPSVPVTAPFQDFRGGGFPAGAFGVGNLVAGFPPRNGNIKTSVLGGSLLNNTTVYAAITNPLTGNLLDIQKSTDGGKNWGAVASPLNYQSLHGSYNTDIIVSPLDPDGAGPQVAGDLVFVAGREANSTHIQQVFMTINGGGSWTDITATGATPRSNAHDLAIDSQGRLLLGSDGGIWRYDRTTGLWSNLNGNLNITQFNSIASHPTDPTIALGGTQSNGTAIFTGNQGWIIKDTTQGNSSRWLPGLANGNDIEFDPKNPLYAYHILNESSIAYPGTGDVAIGTLLRSTDGGNTWPIPISLSIGNNVTSFLVDPINNLRLLAGTNTANVTPTTATLWENTNQGTIPWTNLQPGMGVTALAAATYQGPFVLDPRFLAVTDIGANINDGRTIYVTNGFVIRLTKDHGANWTPNFGPTLIGQTKISEIVVDPSNRDTVYAVARRFAGDSISAASFLGRAITGATNASPIVITTTSTAGLSNGDTVRISGVQGNTAANGTFTITVLTGTTFRLNGTTGNGLYTTGGTWSAGPIVITSEAAHGLASGATVTVSGVQGNDGANGTFTVTVLSATTFSLNGSISSGAYAGGGQWTAPGQGQVFRSTNAGQTWADISLGLPDLPTWKLVIDARTNDLYVGNDDGVWVLPGGPTVSTTWARLGIGLPRVAVHDLDLNLNTNTLSAGTYGRGMFQFYLDEVEPNSGVLRALTGINSWTGPVLLAGAAVINAEGSLNETTVVPAQLTINGIVSDLTFGATNQLTKVGLGKVILLGANTYGGLTDIQEGVVGAGNRQALGKSSQPTIVQAGAALELQSDIELEPLQLKGDGPLFNGHNTGALRNVSSSSGLGNTYTGPITLATVNTTIGVNTGTLLTIGAKASLSGTGTITDGGNNFNLTKELTGTLILASANTYGGITAINQGILQVQDGLALGSTSGPTQVMDNAQLQLQTPSFGASITGASNTSPINITSANHGLASGAQVTITGVLGNTAANGTFTISVLNPNSFTLNSSIPNGAYSGGGIWSAGAGITGASNTGPIVITSSNHSLATGAQVIITGVLGNTAANGIFTITVLSPNTFSLNGSNGNGTYTGGGNWSASVPVVVDGETLNLSGTGTIGDGALLNKAGSNTWKGPVVLTSIPGYLPGTTPTGSVALGVTNAGDTFTIDGAIAEAIPSGLTKLGAGKVVLTKANSHTGTTFINSGIVAIKDGGALGTLVGSIDDASNAGPIVITTTVAHGLVTDTRVIISNVLGNLAANGTFSINVLSPTTFSLNGSTGNGLYIPSLIDTWTRSGALDVQRITTLNKTGFPPGTFTLTFKGQTTSALTFAAPDVGISEVQQLTLGGGPVANTTQFTLTFGANTTPPITYTGTSSDLNTIQIALNALASIGGVGGAVIVTDGGGPNIFNVTFGGSLASRVIVPLTMAVTTLPGVPIVATLTNGSPNGSVQAALNALSTIGGAGGGSVSVTRTAINVPDPPGVPQPAFLYTITFQGALAGVNQPVMTTAITGGTTANVSSVADGGIGTLVSTGSVLELDGDPNAAGASITVAGETLALNGTGIAPASAGGLRNRTGSNTWTDLVTIQSNSSIGADSFSGAIGLSGTISGATNPLSPNPIVITTSVNHGLVNGDQVTITGVLGNTAANGTFTITVLGANTFSLDGSTGNSAYTSGGTWTVGASNTNPIVITTSANQGLVTGDRVTISGVLGNTAANGTFTITVLASNRFSLNGATGNAAYTSGGSWTAGTRLRVTGTVQDPTPKLTPPPTLTKVGTGILAFPNANTYTGNTFVNVGILNIGNATSLGVTPPEIQTVTVSGSSGTFTLSFPFQIPSPVPTGFSSQTVSMPFNVTAAAMQTALNNLSTIGGIERQTLGTTGVGSGSTFTLTFKGAITNAIAWDAPIIQVQNELNSLSTIGGAGGSVVVIGGPANYTINFNGGTLAGFDQPLLLPTPTGGATTSMTQGTQGGVGGSVTVTQVGPVYTVTFGGTLAGLDVPQMTSSGSGGASALNATTQNGGQGGTTVATGASLQVQGSIIVANEGLILNGTGNTGNGALENLLNTNTWDSPVTLASNAFIGVFVITDTLVVKQGINGGFGVTKVGTGTLDYKGRNTYTGPTLVNDGTLLLDYDNSLISGNTILGNLTVGNGTTPTAGVQWGFSNQIIDSVTVAVLKDGTMDLNDKSETFNTLTITDGAATTGLTNAGALTLTTLNMTGGTLTTNGTVNLGTGNVTATSSATGSAIINGLGALAMGNSTRTFAVGNGPQGVDLQVLASITGTGVAGLTKTGSAGSNGLMEIANVSNLYPGNTNIQAVATVPAGGSTGGLMVNGVIGNVTPTLGTTISGTGTVGTFSITGSTVGRGDSGNNTTLPLTGKLNSGPVTWNASTTYFVNLKDTTNFDQLAVTGNITLTGAKLDGLVDPTGVMVINDEFPIITYTGTRTGSFTLTAPSGGSTVYLTNGSTNVKFNIIYDDGLKKVVLKRADKDGSFTNLTPASSTINFGQSSTFTATVTGNVTSGTPTGNVTFMDGLTTLATIALNASGVATYTTTLSNTVIPSPHSITATYNGNTFYNTSTNSPAALVTVNPIASKTTLTMSPTSTATTPVIGSPVTFTATVAPLVAGTATPTGQVTFFIDGVAAPSILPLYPNPATINGSGVAVYQTTTLSAATHTLRADYALSPNYNASTSGNVTYTVNPNPNNLKPTLTLVTAPASGPTAFTNPDYLGTFQRSHGTPSLSVVFASSDSDGPSAVTFLTPTVSAYSQAYDLDQIFGFFFGGNYFQNSRGANEKWFQAAKAVGGFPVNAYYCILPNGEIHALNTVTNTVGVLVGTVDSTFWNDPSLVWNAVAPTDPNLGLVPTPTVTVGPLAGQWTVNIFPAPATTYSGTFQVTAKVTDGNWIITKFITVQVTNNAPTLAAIADIGPTHALPLPTRTLAGNDAPENDTPLTYFAVVSGYSKAYDLDQLYNFYFSGNYYQNSRGSNEKWFQATNAVTPYAANAWYCILPNGEIHAIAANNGIGVLLDTLDSSIWDDPNKLLSAVAPTTPAVTTSFSGALLNVLTLTPPATFTGTFQVTATVKDNLGAISAPQKFLVTIINSPPTVVGGSIIGATNATPIVITTSTNHGLVSGDKVTIAGVLGNLAANGTSWTITTGGALGPNQFSLNGSVGSGAFTSGGTWTPTSINMPVGVKTIPFLATDPDGDTPLTTSVSVVNNSAQAFQLDQQYGFYFAGSYYQNSRGQNEKWFRAANAVGGFGANAWYCLLPNGEVHALNTATNTVGVLVATLDSSFWVDPSLLWNALAPTAPTGLTAVVVAGPSIQITRTAAFTGSAFVTITVSDGRGGTTTLTYKVTAS